MPLGASAQGNSEAAHLCQDGGYLDYTDADGNAFKNTGQCVSYATRGKTLVPVVVADLSIVYVQANSGGGDLTYSGSGLQSGSAVTMDIYYLEGHSLTDHVLGVADSNGNFSLTHGFSCEYFSSITLKGVAADGTPVSVSEAPPC